PLYYAEVGGRLVVSDAASGIESLAPLTPKFASDPVFRSAKEAAGMPEETTGFLFVNLRGVLPVLERVGQASVPPDVVANLRPLQAFHAYGSVAGDTLSLKAFL